MGGVPYVLENGSIAMDAFPNRGKECTVVLMEAQGAADCLCSREGAREEDTQCPISCLPFDEPCLEFLDPDSSIIEGSPSICVSVLPCGHRFSSLALAYHMSVASMRCPICRSGEGKRMRASCIPSHLRPAFKAAVQEFFLKERIERERSEEEMARLFVTQRILGLSSEALLLGDATDIDNQFPMRMTIYMYTRAQSRHVHVVNRDFPLQHNAMRVFAMSAEDSGCLARLITEVAPESISFMVYTRDYDMMPFVMGRSAAIKIGLLQRVNACEGGLVHVASPLQGCDFASGINYIGWISDQSIVQRMMTHTSMHQNL